MKTSTQEEPRLRTIAVAPGEPPRKTILLLQFRNFGDAVILLGLVNSLMQSNPQLQIDVLSRPEFASLFESHPGVRRLYTASFPIGTFKPFTIRAAFGLISQIVAARFRSYDTVANLFGDIRENLCGWLICPGANYGVLWPRAHPIYIQSRHAWRSFLSHTVRVDDPHENVYAGMQQLAAALGSAYAATPNLFNELHDAIQVVPVAKRIGLHLSAGQACKRWPVESWIHLTELLLDAGYEVRLYCAEAESPDFRMLFRGPLKHSNALLVAGSLVGFLEDLATCSLLVGHDSFSMHAAYAIGVPRILINGPNRPEVWAPPETYIAHGNETLSCFPCYGKPTCLTEERPFACIRYTQPSAVFQIVQSCDWYKEARKGGSQE
jgi:heptosyltransferase-3